MENVYLPSRDSKPQGQNTVENPPIGLDFGTTNSVLAHYNDEFHHRESTAYSFPLLDESSVYPSLLYYNKTLDKFSTGIAAKTKLVTEPEAIATSVKRKISEKEIRIAGKIMSPKDIASHIIVGLLREVKSTELKMMPTIITMTVPYYFKQSQNIILQNAAEEAFKEVFGKTYEINLIPEPVSAAIDYIYSNRHGIKNLSQNILIYDIGGGTCDVTVVKCYLSGSNLEFEVLGIDGDGQLGGDDIDQLLLDYICHEVDIDFNVFLADKKYAKSIAVLTEAVRNLKEQLSIQEESNLIVPMLYVNDSYINIDIVVTRQEFSELLRTKKIKGRNETVLGVLDSVMKRLKVKSRNVTVDALLPIGGTSNIPAVQQIVQRNFPNSEHIQLQDNGAQVSVARGAAIVSALKDERGIWPLGKTIQKVSIKMRVPHSLSVAMHDGTLVRLIESNSPAPSKATKTFYATREDATGMYVELPSIDLYQGDGKRVDSDRVELIGRIDLSPYMLYTHGRDLNNIPIQIIFIADATSLTAKIIAAGVNSDGTDLTINEKIKL